MMALLESLPPPPGIDTSGSAPGREAPRILSLTLHRGADTSETAREYLRGLGARCAGRRRPLLIDIRLATDQTEGARTCYRACLPHFSGAVAVVVGTNVSRYLGEFLVAALRSRVNARVFLNEDNAQTWLSTE
jgi:hypothetical protein